MCAYGVSEGWKAADVNGGVAFFEETQGDMVEDGDSGGGESGDVANLLGGFLTTMTEMLNKGEVTTKTFTFSRGEDDEEEDFDVAVASDVPTMYEVLQKVKDKERLLEGASHVSFERQRQGRKKVVSKSIDAFKEMEPKIFFDQAVFPSLEFKLT